MRVDRCSAGWRCRGLCGHACACVARVRPGGGFCYISSAYILAFYILCWTGLCLLYFCGLLHVLGLPTFFWDTRRQPVPGSRRSLLPVTHAPSRALARCATTLPTNGFCLPLRASSAAALRFAAAPRTLWTWRHGWDVCAYGCASKLSFVSFCSRCSLKPRRTFAFLPSGFTKHTPSWQTQSLPVFVVWELFRT